MSFRRCRVTEEHAFFGDEWRKSATLVPDATKRTLDHLVDELLSPHPWTAEAHRNRRRPERNVLECGVVALDCVSHVGFKRTFSLNISICLYVYADRDPSRHRRPRRRSTWRYSLGNAVVRHFFDFFGCAFNRSKNGNVLDRRPGAASARRVCLSTATESAMEKWCT